MTIIKKCIVDEIAKNRQIIIFQLPLYYCVLKPTELIWTQVNAKVADNITI